MTEELEKRIDDEKCEQLIRRIREAHAKGVLKIRDWIAMYDLLVYAYEREKAETYERIVSNSFNDVEGGIQ